MLFATALCFGSSAETLAAKKQAPTTAINLGTASAQELTQLPGIGKAKAEAIVAYRTKQPFQSLDELEQVPGIGSKLLEQLKPHLTLQGGSANALPSGNSPLKPPTAGGR
ncbi:MAG: helix-hairpin-helix domain-containing protein [Deltaproteobacteria bacterium]|nr:helix-hairpin-helix domain-containing protein [Deltaproteobacteria bacterium]